MSLISAICIEYCDQRSICTAKEKGKEYVIDNKGGWLVKKVKVDGCVVPIQAGIKKCDYLFNASANDQVLFFFVELKGSDTVQAVRQVSDTVKLLAAEIGKCSIMARIVGSQRFPQIEGTIAYRKLASKILPTGGNIKIATNKYFKDII